MFDIEFYGLIEAMMAKATKLRVKKAKKALKCVRADCNEPRVQGRRGLCKCHWNKFDYGRRLAKKAGKAALKRYECGEVAAGRVLPGASGSSDKNDYKQRAIACL